jgi:hypothetical protein
MERIIRRKREEAEAGLELKGIFSKIDTNPFGLSAASTKKKKSNSKRSSKRRRELTTAEVADDNNYDDE